MNENRLERARRAARVASALAAGALLLAGAAGAQESPLKRLIPGGADGDKIYYTAVCRDGRHMSVVEDTRTDQTCATSRSGKPRCSADWQLMEAGVYACTVKKGS